MIWEQHRTVTLRFTADHFCTPLTFLVTDGMPVLPAISLVCLKGVSASVDWSYLRLHRRIFTAAHAAPPQYGIKSASRTYLLPYKHHAFSPPTGFTGFHLDRAYDKHDTKAHATCLDNTSAMLFVVYLSSNILGITNGIYTHRAVCVRRLMFSAVRISSGASCRFFINVYVSR